MFKKLRSRLYLKYLAIKRKPLLYLRHALFILLFKFLSLFICIFFTIIPLPISNYLQHLMNLNLSFNSFKDISNSIGKLAYSINNLLPTTNDILRISKMILSNLSLNNILNIIRNLPSDLHQFFIKLFEFLLKVFREIRLFIHCLWPINNLLTKIKIFIFTHTKLVKRIIKNLLIMLFNLLFIKILFLMIIPFLGLTAIYFIGVNISFILVAILSLLTSQLGNLIGNAVHNKLLQLYVFIQKNNTHGRFRLSIIISIVIYEKTVYILLKIRRILLWQLYKLMQISIIAILSLYIYLKIKTSNIHIKKD